MKLCTKIRTLMPILFLLLATIPVSAVERPLAIRGGGVATLITDNAGNLIGAIPSGSGNATHLGQWTVSGTVNYTPDNGVTVQRIRNAQLLPTEISFTFRSMESSIQSRLLIRASSTSSEARADSRGRAAASAS